MYMSDLYETKMIGFSNLLLIFQTENYGTQINYLNDFASKIFENLQYLHFLYLDQPEYFVEPFLELKDN